VIYRQIGKTTATFTCFHDSKKEKRFCLALSETEKCKKYELFNGTFQERCIQILEESSNDGVRSDLAKIAGQLFIQKNEQPAHEEKKYFSSLVENFKVHLGVEATRQALKEYYNIFSKSAASNSSILEVSIRIGIASARFMFFHSTDIKVKDASIAKIKQVLEIRQPLDSTNESYKRSEYMCSYAELLRHYINENIKQECKSHEELLVLFEECIRAYEISSKEAKNNNVQALVGECRTRSRLLSYLSKQLNNKNEYTKMLESKKTQTFIRRSEGAIQEILDILVTVHQEQTYFKFDYNDLFNKCRVGVLKLRNEFQFDFLTTNR